MLRRRDETPGAVDWARVRDVAAGAAWLGIAWGLVALGWWMSSDAAGGAHLAE